MDDSPTLLAALGAGVLSAVSAAVVPLLPGFIGYVWNRGALDTSAFLLGFLLVFVGLGAGATGVGQALLEHLTLFERIAAGAALTFGWTPLGGPVLDRILATATSADTIGRGVGLLSTYAVGRAVPWFVSGLALRAFLRPSMTAGAERTARKLIPGGLVALTGGADLCGPPALDRDATRNGAARRLIRARCIRQFPVILCPARTRCGQEILRLARRSHVLLI
jgi:cytochrome c-type biogenesis protein